MARPIKKTPILTGKDAANFFQQLKNNAIQNTPPNTVPVRQSRFRGGKGGG